MRKFCRKETVILYNFIFCLNLLACSNNSIYESYKHFDDKNWYYDSVAVFNFHIKEKEIYDIYYRVRNTIGYPYYNLYVKYELQDFEKKIKKTDLLENQLMNQKTGYPFGKISRGIYDHEFPLLLNYQFEDTGKYRLIIRQYMRLDTLPHITAVGVKVAKHL